MKTHWYILIFTIIAGTAMFFILFEFPNNKIDQINIDQATNGDYKVYISDLTDSIYYNEGNFYGRNYKMFKEYAVPASGRLSCTLAVQNSIVLTYQDKWFYDVPLTKSENGTGYRIDFKITTEADDTQYLEAVLKKSNKAYLLMNGSMMPMYNKFEMYIKDQQHRNIRVIEEPLIEDSTTIKDSLAL
ncbi:hypothetical protein [Gynurincola endophyticus]|uniref:hypothetical protein n=1 Tax=Gynurincola endophyticus TaxID=2479004 RepID=UPI000F8C50AD|nr:hypothetical protein [Gynurincola endophyticus]